MVYQKAAIEQEIKRLDVAHADAILRGDLAALDKIWTSDFKVNRFLLHQFGCIPVLLICKWSRIARK